MHGAVAGPVPAAGGGTTGVKVEILARGEQRCAAFACLHSDYKLSKETESAPALNAVPPM